MTIVKRLGTFLLGTLMPVLAHAGEGDPLALLDRMNEAIRSLDYEGHFVVQSGERLDALYIVHRVNDGNEKERLVSLTGEAREIIRGDQAVACLVPGRKQPINVGRRAQGRSYSPLTVIDAQQLKQSYRFEMLEPDRVAGRDAHKIEVHPRDELRFGYRLFIDQSSGLPLRTILLGGDSKAVSQMMFTDLKVGDGITPIEHDLSALQHATADSTDWSPLERLAPASWAFSDTPPGFQLNVHRRRATHDKTGELEHFIFSDGLATVSVYVQPSHGDGALSGASRHGAANAVGRSIGSHEIIVVGEVPMKTLQWFANSVQAAP